MLLTVLLRLSNVRRDKISIYRKIPKISHAHGAYIFQRPFLRGLFLEGLIFGGAYVRREICDSKSIGLACSGREIYHFCFVLLCIRGQIPSTSSRGAYIRRGDLTEGFLRYDFEGLIFGGTYTWRGLFSEFYGTLSSVSSLVKGRTCARDPVQQLFFSVPYGISTEAHA